MRIQLYSLSEDRITWAKDGTLGEYNGEWSVKNMESGRSIERLDRFLSLNKGKIGDNEWLLSLPNVLYVPFIRFGDEIEEKKPESDEIVEKKPESKEKKGENQPIQDESTSETDE